MNRSPLARKSFSNGEKGAAEERKLCVPEERTSVSSHRAECEPNQRSQRCWGVSYVDFAGLSSFFLFRGCLRGLPSAACATACEPVRCAPEAVVCLHPSHFLSVQRVPSCSYAGFQCGQRE
jgi:hypothetical protein